MESISAPTSSVIITLLMSIPNLLPVRNDSASEAPYSKFLSSLVGDLYKCSPFELLQQYFTGSPYRLP
ncbi:hypothetical protein V6N13_102795 [Hibiscus sabdariffa]